MKNVMAGEEEELGQVHGQAGTIYRRLEAGTPRTPSNVHARTAAAGPGTLQQVCMARNGGTARWWNGDMAWRTTTQQRREQVGTGMGRRTTPPSWQVAVQQQANRRRRQRIGEWRHGAQAVGKRPYI